MIRARCPGHITCFFSLSDRGSVGTGIRISAYANVEITLRDGSEVNVVMDGTASEAPITKRVLETLMPGIGADVTITNDLPVSQGFGMSAAGAIAAGLCACKVSGRSTNEAYAAAHEAEIALGGGRGDVAAIMSNYEVPVRVTPGIRPQGKIIDSRVEVPRIAVAVLGPPLHTGSILSNAKTRRNISIAGFGMHEEFLEKPSASNLVSLSRRFSGESGLETPEVTKFLKNDKNAAMCMLGNSVFTIGPGFANLPPGAVQVVFRATDEQASLM